MGLELGLGLGLGLGLRLGLGLGLGTLLQPACSASEAVPSVSEADVAPGGALRRRTLLRPACSPSVSVAVASASEDDEPCAPERAAPPYSAAELRARSPPARNSGQG